MSEKIDKAMALFKERKYEEAIDAFSLVLENEPDNADIYNNMGVAYSCLGNFDQAERFYTKALELDPELAQAYINLSDLYYKAGDLPSALGTLQRGTYELPENLAIAHLLARVYIEDQRWEDAIIELERVLDGEPENYDAYYALSLEITKARFQTLKMLLNIMQIMSFCIMRWHRLMKEITRLIKQFQII